MFNGLRGRTILCSILAQLIRFRLAEACFIYNYLDQLIRLLFG